jgi:DNA invertase Pin-like site-specific DNA recombinase
MQTRCGIYRRISDDREGRELGIDRQLQDCQARAAREGWVVSQVFTDNDLSASTRSRKPRPGYAALLEAAERGEIDVILAYSNSRLTRRPMELEALVSLYERTKVRICTIASGDTNLGSADGRAIARTLAAWDSAEAERTGERVARANRQRAEAGGWHGKRCTGYEADGSLVPGEAEAIRDAVSSVIAGASLHEIARRWDLAGLVRVRGGLWREQPTKVRDVLTAWRIAGIAVRKGEPLLDVEAQWPSIVTREELAQVRAILLAPERRTNAHRAARRSLLSGLAMCGACGSPLRSSTHEGGRPNRSTGRVSIYRCSGIGCGLLIRAYKLDEPVVAAVLVELLTADLAALSPSEDDRSCMSDLRIELDKVDRARQDIATLIEEGHLSLSAARLSLEALQGRQRAAQGQLEALSRKFAPATFVAAQRDLLLLSDEDRDARSDAVTERFYGLDLGQRRGIVSALVEVKVHPGRNDDRVEIWSRASKQRIRSHSLQIPRFS